ncbi:putative integral membrane protein [Babesia bovis T2Bo]|uniref:Uncharacterized protein n=1 Tax=Babesia bovis TaxID=5865 RepID=A7AQ63_BABBO|nr:putative integral membrane protein [Babesia bovis T2Bo]EDO08697.1 putative integral membrane protein [Babesia bovis T2Bo]|eukprot:XP_001612265.1 hypothetical protein [Babesia bovis T2Bo]
MRPFKFGWRSTKELPDLHEEVIQGNINPIAMSNSAKTSVSPISTTQASTACHADAKEQDISYDYYQLYRGESDTDSDEFYDTIGDIYTLGVTESNDKAALYGRMMHYYADQTGRISHPHSSRSKLVLWYMLVILVSNPIIGLYTMRHFKDWDTWVTRDVVITDAVKPVPFVNVSPSAPQLRSTPTEELPLTLSHEEHGILSKVAKTFSRKVTWYAYYEVFGELVFALFTLTLLCTSGMCCTNGEHRVQSMIPVIGVLYTMIYKLLAMYVLILSFKILFFYLVAAHPNVAQSLPLVLIKLLGLPGTDASNPAECAAMSQLVQLDKVAHRWVLVYCLENVYITITESIETTYALYNILKRCVKKVLRKIRRQQELVYFTVGSPSNVESSSSGSGNYSCSYMLLDSLLNKVSAPQESYIHHLYNNPKTDVGTYLANVDVEMFQHGIEEVGAKLLSKLGKKNNV